MLAVLVEARLFRVSERFGPAATFWVRFFMAVLIAVGGQTESGALGALIDGKVPGYFSSQCWWVINAYLLVIASWVVASTRPDYAAMKKKRAEKKASDPGGNGSPR